MADRSMARIPAAELERLKAEIAVERLVQASGVELKSAGKDLMGRCPFHDDREASLVVTPTKNLWYCFGCQIGGGPIDWVMKARGVSFRHAVEILRAGDLAGGPKSGNLRALAPPIHFDAGDATLMSQAIAYYHERLKQTPEALAYLARRGIEDAELIDRFRIGFADRTLGLRLPEKTRKAGHEIRTRLQKLGLLRESGHEHFNGSIVIPVISPDGEITEVYGRKINDNLREGTPYHLYLPGPHRGVWNESALEASTEIIVCEALIDALTFWRAGYRNVTAAYGIEGFTADHLAAFKRHGTQRVLIAYDRDEAGERAAERLAERLMPEGLECYRIQFPKGMDANEYALKLTPAEKSLGLLHQYQRVRRTAQENGETIEYIEATLEDIEHANRLAHEVLGRSLDELPPQTRRVLALLVAMVEECCRAREVSRPEYHFSRREVRKYTGLSDTQLRVHLDRLVTLEYLLVHRGMRGQSFVYELLFDGPAKSESPHLSGLIDVATMKSSRGLDPKLAGSTRGDRGQSAGASRSLESAQRPENISVPDNQAAETVKLCVLKPNGRDASHVAASVAAIP